MGKAIWENPLKHGWEKVSNWECLFVHREKSFFLSVYVDDIKLAGKKQHIDPMWKVLNEEVDLGEPISFLDHVYLGCTQRQCEIRKDIVDNCRTMFESRISAEGTEKLPYSENLRISSWSYDMEGHAKKCVERYCESANRTTQQLYKVSTPCIDDHHFKEEELKSVGELSNRCSQIVLKCLYLEDLIFYGQWTKLHDRSRNGPKLVTNDCVVWYLTSITHQNTNSIVMWVILLSNAGWDCSKTPILRAILRTQKSTSGGTLCVFGSHTFVPISWMCKKQTSVSYSSTESEKFSLDAGLSLDGIPVLDLWDLIVSVFGDTTQNHDRTERPRCLPSRDSQTQAISKSDQPFG